MEDKKPWEIAAEEQSQSNVEGKKPWEIAADEMESSPKSSAPSGQGVKSGALQPTSPTPSKESTSLLEDIESESWKKTISPKPTLSETRGAESTFPISKDTYGRMKAKGENVFEKDGKFFQTKSQIPTEVKEKKDFEPTIQESIAKIEGLTMKVKYPEYSKPSEREQFDFKSESAKALTNEQRAEKEQSLQRKENRRLQNLPQDIDRLRKERADLLLDKSVEGKKKLAANEAVTKRMQQDLNNITNSKYQSLKNLNQKAIKDIDLEINEYLEDDLKLRDKIAKVGLTDEETWDLAQRAVTKKIAPLEKDLQTFKEEGTVDIASEKIRLSNDLHSKQQKMADIANQMKFYEDDYLNKNGFSGLSKEIDLAKKKLDSYKPALEKAKSEVKLHENELSDLKTKLESFDSLIKNGTFYGTNAQFEELKATEKEFNETLEDLNKVYSNQDLVGYDDVVSKYNALASKKNSIAQNLNSPSYLKMKDDFDALKTEYDLSYNKYLEFEQPKIKERIGKYFSTIQKIGEYDEKLKKTKGSLTTLKEIEDIQKKFEDLGYYGDALDIGGRAINSILDASKKLVMSPFRIASSFSDVFGSGEDVYHYSEWIADLVEKPKLFSTKEKNVFYDAAKDKINWGVVPVLSGLADQTGIILTLALTGKYANPALQRSMTTAGMDLTSAAEIAESAKISSTIAPSFAISYGDNYKEARSKGFGTSGAIAYSSAMSLLEGITELLLPDQDLVFGKGVKEKMLSNFIKDYSRGKKYAIKKLANDFIYNAGSELTEENIAALGGTVSTFIGSLANDDIEVEVPTINQTITTSVTSGLAGGGMGLFGQISESSQIYKMGVMNLAKDFENGKDFLTRLKERGKIEESRYDKLISDAQKYQSVSGKIPKGLSKYKTFAIAEKMIAINDLYSEMDKDEKNPINKINKKKINSIQDEIEQIIDDKDFDKRMEAELEVEVQELIKEEELAKPILKKNTSPTDEKYGTINRNDGKGVVDLTKEEYLREEGKLAGEEEQLNKQEDVGIQPLDTRNAKPIEEVALTDINKGDVIIGYHSAPTGDIGTGGELGIHIGTKEVAENINNSKRGGKGEVKRLAFKPKKPLILGDMPSWSSINVLNELLRQKFTGVDKEKLQEIRDSDLSEKEKQQSIIDLIKGQGYDSVVYQNFDEGNGEYSYILFDNKQLNDLEDVDIQQQVGEGKADIGEVGEVAEEQPQAEPTKTFEQKVEETAKALEDELKVGGKIDSDGFQFRNEQKVFKIADTFTDEMQERYQKEVFEDEIKTPEQFISEAYHKDKAAGKETELTKAVEELIGKPTEAKADKSVLVDEDGKPIEKWWLEKGADVEKMTDAEFEERVLTNNLDDFDQQIRRRYKEKIKAEENKIKFKDEDWGKWDNKQQEQKVVSDLPKNIEGYFEVSLNDGTKILVKARTKTIAEEKVYNKKGFRASGKFIVSTEKAEYANYPKLAKAKLESLPKEQPAPTEEKVSGGLTLEEKSNLESISKEAGVNFQEVRNVYNKYGEGKPLSEITLEDYKKAEEKRSGLKEGKVEEEAKSPEEKAAIDKERLWSKVRAYNGLSKRERSDMFGNNLRADIMSEAAAMKYTINPTKSGKYILIDNNGKQVKRIGTPRSKDVIQEEKRIKERRSRARRELPMNVKHSVAQDIANGVQFDRESLKKVSGLRDNEIPFWMTRTDGKGVSLEFYNVRFQEKGGYYVEDDMDFQSEVADAIGDFAFKNGRSAALEYIERKQEELENGGLTDAEIKEQNEYYQAKLDEENFDYFAEYLSGLSDEEAQLLSDELREAEKQYDELLINEILNESENKREAEQGKQDANIEAPNIKGEGETVKSLEEKLKSVELKIAKKQSDIKNLTKDNQANIFAGAKVGMFDNAELLKDLTNEIKELNQEANALREKIEAQKEKEGLVEQPKNQLEIDESIVEAPKVKAIRQLGSGANVYFETDKYRVNDLQNGKVVLNIQNKTDAIPIANIEFDNPNDAVIVAKEIARIYPNGVPDAVLIDKVIEDIKEKLLTPKTQENAVQKPSTTQEVSRNGERGENKPEGGEGVGQGKQGEKAPTEGQEEIDNLFNVYESIDGLRGADKRNAADEFRNMQANIKSPTLKRIFDNIKDIHSQLEKQGLITKTNGCP